MKGPFRFLSFLVLLGMCVTLLPTLGAKAQLKHYKLRKKEFWTHPPEDWFLGDETEAQKGLAHRPTRRCLPPRLKSRRISRTSSCPTGFKISV